MARNLLVNADDFGYSKERNKGILKCIRQGVVSSVSILVNGTALKEIPDLLAHSVSVGLHFNITEGIPICNPHQVSSLVDPNGFFLGKFGLRENLEKGNVCLDQVRMELEAQLRVFRQSTGLDPTHVDGHQHIHVWPGVRGVFANVLSQESIWKTRLPREPEASTCDWLEDGARRFYANVTDMAVAAENEFISQGLRFADVFFGMRAMGRNMTLSRLQDGIIKAFQQDSQFCELMVHPGYKGNPLEGGCGNGPDDFDLSSERQHELNILRSVDFGAFLKEQNINMISYAHL